jgi:hypothetical protein
MKVFFRVVPGIGAKTIKQLFRVFREAFTGEDLVNAMLEAGFAENRQAAETKGQLLINANVLNNLASAKEPFKDKDKCILGLSLKGKILLYGHNFLLPSIDDLLGEELIDKESLSKQFSIIKIQDIYGKFDLMEALVNRMTSNPNIFLSEYSDHVLTQGLTGLNIQTKDRTSKKTGLVCKNSFYSDAAIDWLISNTNIESRQQAVAFGEYMLKKGVLKSVNPNIVNGINIENFPDSKDNAFYLIQGMGASKQNVHLSDNSLNNDGSNLALTPPKATSTNQDNSANSNSNSSRRALLLQIIDNPDSCQIFEDFLRSIYCSENLLFYLMVRTYKRTFTKTKVGEEERFSADPKSSGMVAKQICDKYLKGESLNVEQNSKKSVRAEIEKGEYTYHLFDGLQKHVFGIMLSDSLAKFTKTKAYMDLESANFQSVDAVSYPYL